ncbi:YjbF family lipoprotein, partial [Vibrio parahaemolyticus]|nr:YjbF family lipoprotein [Vibrio parahaemolyticus]
MNIFKASKWIRPLLTLPLFFIIQGCTQKFNDVSATVQEAYGNYIDVEMTPEE